MEDRTAIITLRIEPTIKAEFERIARENDQTSSQILRKYIKGVVIKDAEANAQGSLDLSTTPQSKRGKK